jgi:hypothetical protein
MKVALAARYRSWMFVLVPATLGLGTVALWLHSRNWPLMIDETGVRLRSQRYLNWTSITKLSVSRSYLDGSVSHVRMHHSGGVTKIPVTGLEDGESVLSTMISLFKRTNGLKDREESIDRVALSEPHIEHNFSLNYPAPKTADRDAVPEFYSRRDTSRHADGEQASIKTA